MKHTGHIEIEMKFRIGATGPMEPLLEAAGFQRVHPRGEEVSVLWDRGAELRDQGCALRTRRYHGMARVTWKGAKVEDPFLKIRPEVETGVEDADAMEGILTALGFRPSLAMRKFRSVWRRGELEACLDEAPFGAFLELEGAPEAIRAAMPALGLGEDQAETRSYPTLFQLHAGPGAP